MIDESPARAAAGEAVANIAEYTVSEIAGAVKRTLEGSFEHVRVRGEVSRPNYHGSGHLYFTLKDEGAVLDVVCWKGTVGRIGLRIEEGMEVVCTGRVSSYPRSSKYQLVIEAVELAGEGALLKLLEDRRKKLLAEGLFDPARKKPIPFLPAVIGVVTSPTGAVIRDILHRLADRFPRRVLLWPVPVQGEGAAEKIAAAIRGFNSLGPDGSVPRPDLLIVARGGGSLEDLWAFNEEVVVRAAAASAIPLISAIGHETDTTLIDFAADRRAPTPTAAAEMAVPVRAEILAQVLDHERRLVAAADRTLRLARARIEGLARGLPVPARLFELADQRLDDLADRLAGGIRQLVRLRGLGLQQAAARLRTPEDQIRRRADALAALALRLDRRVHGVLGDRIARFEGLGASARLAAAVARLARDRRLRLESLARLLDSLSYRGVLARGFVLVRHDERPITRAGDTDPGMSVTLQFQDGTRRATIDGDKKPRRRGGRDDDQGSLL
ncbi:MAG: exodeoxyribonuclease VII large subunit [Alphaproteobacteria bacterium]|nr:exodeoxyribonuclease VII large subunit [Alphaproteobacteria bacterium]